MRKSMFILAVLMLAAAVPARADAPPIPAMMFAALETGDLPRAEAFYTGALGMKRVMRISHPGDPYVKDALNFSGMPMSAEPLLILMHHDDPKTAPPVSAVLLGMHVADAHAAAAKVRAAGYPVLREPAPDDHSAKLTTLVKDPDGNTIELVQIDMSRLR